MNRGEALRQRLPADLVDRYRQARARHRLTSPKSCFYVAKAGPFPERDWKRANRKETVSWREGDLAFEIEISRDDGFCAGDLYGRFTESYQEGAIRLDPCRFAGLHMFFVPATTVAEHQEMLRYLGYGKHEAWRKARSFVLQDLELLLKDRPVYQIAVSAFFSPQFPVVQGQEKGIPCMGRIRLAFRTGTGFTEMTEARESAELYAASARIQALQELSLPHDLSGAYRN